MIRSIYFSFKFLVRSFSLVAQHLVYELVALLIFVIAAAVVIVAYTFWLPQLAFISVREYCERDIPMSVTWRERYYLGERYNPENTYMKNAEFFLVTPVKNFWSSVAEVYQDSVARI